MKESTCFKFFGWNLFCGFHECWPLKFWSFTYSAKFCFWYLCISYFCLVFSSFNLVGYQKLWQRTLAVETRISFCFKKSTSGLSNRHSFVKFQALASGVFNPVHILHWCCQISLFYLFFVLFLTISIAATLSLFDVRIEIYPFIPFCYWKKDSGVWFCLYCS